MSDMQLKPQPLTNNERGSRITGRPRHALDLIIDQGLHYTEAADQVGLSRRSMRLVVEKPIAQAYLKQRYQERLHLDKPRAFHALMSIAMTNDQMPGVQACKTILLLDDENKQTRQTSPGVVIQIISDKDNVGANVSKIINNDET